MASKPDSRRRKTRAKERPVAKNDDEERNERICRWAAKRLLNADMYKFCIFQVMAKNRPNYCEMFLYEWFLGDAPTDVLYDFIMQELKLKKEPTMLFVRPRKRWEMQDDEDAVRVPMTRGQMLRDLDKGVETLTFQVTPCG